jgi:hypothetical protein
MNYALSAIESLRRTYVGYAQIVEVRKAITAISTSRKRLRNQSACC